MNAIRDALGNTYEVPSVGPRNAPKAGEQWVVNVESQDVATVVIAVVRDTYVIAWPVTADADAAAWPAIRLGNNLAWPHCEFGMDTAALSRRVTAVLDERTTSDIRFALWERENIPVPTQPKSQSPESRQALNLVCDQAWALGDWSWPNNKIGEGVFSADLLHEAGVSPSDIAALLQVSPGVARKLADGEAVPTREQVSLVLGQLPEGTIADDLLIPVEGPEADALTHPEFKPRVVSLQQKMGGSEGSARSAVWQKSMRAARQAGATNSPEGVRTRLDQAFRDLLSKDD